LGLPVPIELDAGVAFDVETKPGDDVTAIGADGDIVGDGFFGLDAGDFEDVHLFAGLVLRKTDDHGGDLGGIGG
jgi:hypothetical protein